MKTIQGIIEKKLIRDGESNGEKWRKTTFLIGGAYYGSFESGADEFKEGNEVSLNYDLSKDGKYNNIKSIVLIAENPMPIKQERVTRGITQIKVLQTDKKDEFETAVNTWSKELEAFATQTHISVISDNTTWKIVYTAVLFYYS